jgi:hypothetical protein
LIDANMPFFPFWPPVVCDRTSIAARHPPAEAVAAR